MPPSSASSEPARWSRAGSSPPFLRRLGPRFLLLFVGILAASGAALTIQTRRLVWQQLRTQAREELRLILSSLDFGVTPLLAAGSMEAVQRMLENIGSYPDIEDIRLYGVDLVVLASANTEEIGRRMPETAAGEALTSQKLLSVQESYASRDVSAAVPIRGGLWDASRSTDVAAALFVRADLDRLLLKLEPLQRTFTLWTSMASVAVIVVLAGALALWVLLPLHSLSTATARAAAGDYSARAEVRRTDELGHFASLYNAMLDEIERQNRELTAYAAGLEEKVRERTGSLEKSNRDLEAAYEELKRTQGRLVQSEKMASIGQLAAGVAHEINNPMAYIKSNLGTMQRYLGQMETFVGGVLDGQDPQELAKRMDLDYLRSDMEALVAESLEGSLRVESIVKNLKDFAHIDTGDVSHADVNGLLDSTLQVIWNQVKYKAEVRKDYGQLPQIHCYAQRLGQVFLNILLNAAQAIERQGVISITTRQEGEMVSICIRDTGPGIAPEHLDRIFEPFFTTKDVGKGTGLGLSVSYDIVKNHRGEIRVDSAPGKGAAFTILLPIEPEFPAEAPEAGAT